MKEKALIALLSFVLLFGCQSEIKIEDDLGLQFYSLRHQFEKDIPGTLEMINNWGIRNIEGGETYGMDVDQFKELLVEYDLKVVSVGADFNMLKDNPEKIVEIAKTFNASYAMCPWIPHEGDNFTIEDTKGAIAVFNNAGEILANEGIELVYHPHGYEFRPYGDGLLFDYMVSQSDHFDFEMDVFWFHHGGADPMTYLNKYPDQFKLMHLKDMRKDVVGNNKGHEDVETNVILGSGQIDIAGLVQRGRELGIAYMFIEDESSRAQNQVPKSLEFLAQLK